jgi:hypothetical protein
VDADPTCNRRASLPHPDLRDPHDRNLEYEVSYAAKPIVFYKQVNLKTAGVEITFAGARMHPQILHNSYLLLNIS